MSEHPLQRFWIEESGWHDPAHPVPELALSEGNLCINTWNTAIREALKCVAVGTCPTATREMIEHLIYVGATS